MHRIGFDPPPIKEEKRLTGELDAIKNFSKQEEIADEDEYQFMKLALARLETLIHQKKNPLEADKTLFEKGIISKADWDKVISSYEIAEANKDSEDFQATTHLMKKIQ